MSVKTLRKQLFAAIAMVLVAAIALGSSTYAWFVSNNSVKATTANISAQSNAAFLQIGQTQGYNGGETSTTFTTPSATALYPSTVANNGSGNYQFKTGYAASKGAATINAAGLKVVDQNTPETLAKYAVREDVYISAQEGSFSNLVVSGLEVTGAGQLNEAMRVLVVNAGDTTRWTVWKPAAAEWTGQTFIDGKDLYTITNPNAAGDETYATRNVGISTGQATLKKSEYEALAPIHTEAVSGTPESVAMKVEAGNETLSDTVGTVANSGEVHLIMYVFYEGADHHIYTDNITQLGEARVTVTFDATQNQDA